MQALTTDTAAAAAPVSLRRAGPGDAAAVAALTEAAYTKWIPVLGRLPKPMTADCAEAVQRHRIDLLFAGSDLAALIEMIPAADHLLVENLAVAPDFQGHGYARKLMAHAEQVARDLGYREIRLYTNKLFAANVAFYRKLGYRLDREEAFKGGFLVHLSKAVEG